MESKENLPCPITEIAIDENREIVDCDNLSFPWNIDSNGYFLVKIIDETICCGFVNPEHKMNIEFRGKDPDKMIKEITKRELCSKENLAYISQELMIAYNSIKNGEKYVQR